MIDKLDIRVPGHVQFTKDFGKLYSAVKGDTKRWKQSQYYAISASFDDCGIDALLHMNCTMTKKPLHKLEILRTGEKTYEEMLEVCSGIFDCDPLRLGIMRADLTADVADVPVDWFKRHSLVRSKQTRRELGTVEPYQTVTKGRAQTLYAGVKPNQVRIYDKTAERVMQYGKYLIRHRRAAEMADLPADENLTSFETMYGHSPLAVITRVERQCAGRDLEKLRIPTVGCLWEMDKLDPFSKVMFFDSPRREERVEDWGFTDWCVGMHLKERVQALGLAETYNFLRQHHGKNFDRAKKKYAPFLRVTDNVIGIDGKRLRSLYQQSAYRQLLRAA